MVIIGDFPTFCVAVAALSGTNVLFSFIWRFLVHRLVVQRRDTRVLVYFSFTWQVVVLTISLTIAVIRHHSDQPLAPWFDMEELKWGFAVFCYSGGVSALILRPVDAILTLVSRPFESSYELREIRVGAPPQTIAGLIIGVATFSVALVGGWASLSGRVTIDWTFWAAIGTCALGLVISSTMQCLKGEEQSSDAENTGHKETEESQEIPEDSIVERERWHPDGDY